MRRFRAALAALAALPLLAGGCAIPPWGPNDLVVVQEPVQDAEGVSRTPTFRWRLLDPAINDLVCNLYEAECTAEHNVWMATGLERFTMMTYPRDGNRKLAWGVSDPEVRLKPNTSYIARFSYAVGPVIHEPVLVRFKTGSE